MRTTLNPSHHVPQQLRGLPGAAPEQTVIDQAQTCVDELLQALSRMLLPSEEDLGLWDFVAQDGLSNDFLKGKNME